MACGLVDKPGWDTRLLLSSDLHAQDYVRVGCSRMDKLPDIRLPFTRRTLETLWRTTGHPLLDRWLDGADWVYCPKELYDPVRKSRYAITVHERYRLEPKFQQRFS